MRLFVFALLLASAAPRAQTEPFAGRWLALSVTGDADASRDLATGALEKVLVVNPGGHVILRGTDRVRGEGATFSGRLFGDVVRFAELPGVARVAIDGRRLVFTDPAGRQTRFIRMAPEPF